ncbi:MAG: hypothetical protein IKH37_01235 [Prevotella sp.]|nr:hypothetical protein [Prevotella sp.]
MKKLAFYLAFITLSLNIQAQDNQQKVKELEATIQSLQTQIDEYQKALNIKNAPNFQMFENLKLSIESVEGDENTGELIVTIKTYNNGPDIDFQVLGETIIDFSGKTYQCYDAKLNDGITSRGTFYKDTPGSIKIRVKNIQNSPSRLNAIILKCIIFIPFNDKEQKIKFRDVPVIWK